MRGCKGTEDYRSHDEVGDLVAAENSERPVFSVTPGSSLRAMADDASSVSLSSASGSARPDKPKLPITAIPDMRFEQSFLASIRGFVHEVEHDTAEELKREEKQGAGEKTNKHGGKASSIMATRSRTGEPELWLGRLRIEWLPLMYLTVRDQILSPVIQGAVFGIGGLALGHLRAYLVARRQARRTAA